LQGCASFLVGCLSASFFPFFSFFPLGHIFFCIFCSTASSDRSRRIWGKRRGRTLLIISPFLFFFSSGAAPLSFFQFQEAKNTAKEFNGGRYRRNHSVTAEAPLLHLLHIVRFPPPPPLFFPFLKPSFFPPPITCSFIVWWMLNAQAKLRKL